MRDNNLLMFNQIQSCKFIETSLDKSFVLFYKMYFVKEANKDLMTKKDDHHNLDHGAFNLQHDG